MHHLHHTYFLIRWGPLGHEKFKTNLDEFIKNIRFKAAGGTHTFWITTPPSKVFDDLFLLSLEIFWFSVSEETGSRAMAFNNLVFQNYLTRYNLVELNHFASTKLKANNVNVIDIFFSLQSQIAFRNKDGIHWYPEANR